MSCILSEEMLERLMQDELSEAQREVVRAHLLEDCEECAPRIAKLDEALLIALAPQDSLLEPAEANAMFAASLQASGSADTPWWSRWTSFWRVEYQLMAVAAVLLIALLLVPRFLRPKAVGYEGIKGSGVVKPVALDLIGLVGQGGKVIRRAGQPAKLQPSQVLLLRYRLLEPGYVKIWALGKDGGTHELLPGAQMRPAGEHELTQRKMALSIDPAQMGGAAKVLAVASRGPLSRLHWKTAKREELARACPDCQRVVLSVQMERAP